MIVLNILCSPGWPRACINLPSSVSRMQGLEYYPWSFKQFYLELLSILETFCGRGEKEKQIFKITLGTQLSYYLFIWKQSLTHNKVTPRTVSTCWVLGLQECYHVQLQPVSLSLTSYITPGTDEYFLTLKIICHLTERQPLEKIFILLQSLPLTALFTTAKT